MKPAKPFRIQKDQLWYSPRTGDEIKVLTYSARKKQIITSTPRGAVQTWDEETFRKFFAHRADVCAHQRSEKKS